MVKALDAPYAAGRRGAGWLKVKPRHTLDLVVLAAEWGHGRRRGWLSNLHLGARDAGRPGFVMLGKTFKGLTDAMLTWQTERLLALEVARDDWTVHVRPELVVEIAFDGVQTSPRYPGGVALRFARVLRHRPDKRAAEADTLDAVLAVHAGGPGRRHAAAPRAGRRLPGPRTVRSETTRVPRRHVLRNGARSAQGLPRRGSAGACGAAGAACRRSTPLPSMMQLNAAHSPNARRGRPVRRAAPPSARPPRAAPAASRGRGARRVEGDAAVLVAPRARDRAVDQEGRHRLRHAHVRTRARDGARGGSRRGARGRAGSRPTSPAGGPAPASRGRAAARAGRSTSSSPSSAAKRRSRRRSSAGATRARRDAGPVGDLGERGRAEAAQVAAHGVVDGVVVVHLGRAEPVLGQRVEVRAAALPRPRRRGAHEVQPVADPGRRPLAHQLLDLAAPQRGARRAAGAACAPRRSCRARRDRRGWPSATTRAAGARRPAPAASSRAPRRGGSSSA